jgi:predicted site-specific integrase-resolvase
MKSAEVLKLLKITRPTLTSYVKLGKIKATLLGNGYYDYDEESIYNFLGQHVKIIDRINVIYCRVSTYKQKNDLANQILDVIDYCNTNNLTYNKVYQEIASGIDFDRSEFSKLITDVINKKIAIIFIAYKDRLSRLSYLTLESMFKQFGTQIVVINDLSNDDKNMEDDLFEELISIIHLFSTKICSSHRKKIINECKLKLNS